MELAEEFRTRAQRCLQLAHSAPTLEAQTHWLAMAQLWFSLAEHAEDFLAAWNGMSWVLQIRILLLSGAPSISRMARISLH